MTIYSVGGLDGAYDTGESMTKWRLLTFNEETYHLESIPNAPLFDNAQDADVYVAEHQLKEKYPCVCHWPVEDNDTRFQGDVSSSMK